MTPEREAQLYRWLQEAEQCPEIPAAAASLRECLDVAVALREERDFWEEERQKAGLEAHDLGNRLGDAQEACKRLRERAEKAEAEIERMKSCGRCGDTFTFPLRCPHCRQKDLAGCCH